MSFRSSGSFIHLFLMGVPVKAAGKLALFGKFSIARFRSLALQSQGLGFALLVRSPLTELQVGVA